MVTTGTKQKVLNLYTDGSCDYRTKLGGYAFTFGTVNEKGQKIRISGSGAEKDTTISRMELKAVIAGLSYFTLPEQITVYSDSQYVVKPFTEQWIHDWLKEGLQYRKNGDLWQQLWTLHYYHKVKFQWVRGHDNNPGNEWCDTLASIARLKESPFTVTEEPDILVDAYVSRNFT